MSLALQGFLFNDEMPALNGHDLGRFKIGQLRSKCVLEGYFGKILWTGLNVVRTGAGAGAGAGIQLILKDKPRPEI